MPKLNEKQNSRLRHSRAHAVESCVVKDALGSTFRTKLSCSMNVNPWLLSSNEGSTRPREFLERIKIVVMKI